LPAKSDNPSSQIAETLKERLRATHIAIVDESHLHAGHKASGGGGHFVVTIVSPQFEDKTLIDRHRAVYEALRDKMKSGEIHALSLKTLTPAEWKISQ